MMLGQVGEKVSRSIHLLPWKRIKKITTYGFFLVFAYLIVTKARELDWAKIGKTLIDTDPVIMGGAVALGLMSYTAYASYDLIGRYLLKLNTSAPKTLLMAWVSYACNLNLGAIIGSIALRYRLYSKMGLSAKTVTKILSISVASNWTGYMLLTGLLFVSGSFDPPSTWVINKTGFQWLGALFILINAAYIALVLFSKKREFSLRQHDFTLPTTKVIAWQYLTAFVHWSLMVAVMYQFFKADVDFTAVYVVLLVSSIAGAVSHVPGGLGVIEAVFLALLPGDLPNHEIVAGVFAYRCAFYLFPLAIALPMYFIFESSVKSIKPESRRSNVSP